MDSQTLEKLSAQRYDRQTVMYGKESIQLYRNTHCLIIGQRGLGSEIAKNIFLLGSPVTIIDNGVVEPMDLDSNCFLRKEDIGQKTRGQASFCKIKELNPLNQATLIEDTTITSDLLSKFNVVIVTEFHPLDDLIKWNSFCRSQEKPIGFIFCMVAGVWATSFTDFGPNFVCLNHDGRDPQSSIIQNIELAEDEENQLLISLPDKENHNLSDGDFVCFKDVKGMPYLCKPNSEFQIHWERYNQFRISYDKSLFSEEKFEGHGKFIQIKKPKTFQFRSLEDSLNNQLEDDEENIQDEKSLSLQKLLKAIFKFGKLPELNNKEQIDQIYNIYKESNQEVVEDFSEEGFVKKISRFMEIQMSCHISYLGAIVAQEALKYVGKFQPMFPQQWLQASFDEVLPEQLPNLQKSELRGSRYDSYLAVFGEQTLQKMKNCRIFMPGAGAVGCEYLKMLALMGFSSGEEGRVTCLDHDHIELSNLNRQFLFRDKDIGQPKVTTAANATKEMNPEFNVDAYELKAERATEHIFDDDFWRAQTMILNAVDSIGARQYTDNMGAFYEKPIFNCGTEGLLSTSNIYFPHQTTSFRDFKFPEDVTYASCTVKNFPYKIDHTIQFAKEIIFESFTSKLRSLIDKISSSKAEDFDKEQEMIIAENFYIYKLLLNPTIEGCIQMAYQAFKEYFNEDIEQLQSAHPKDSLSQDGRLYWSGGRVFPQALTFDENDAIQQMFLDSLTCLLARQLNIPQKEMDSLSNLHPKFYDKNNTLQNQHLSDDDIKKRVDEIIDLLKKNGVNKGLKFESFDKDDDLHVDLIYATSNLKARVHFINEEERHIIKVKAGKITPSTITSTALIVGFVGNEILKYLQGKPLDSHRTYSGNLGFSDFSWTQYWPPKIQKSNQEEKILYNEGVMTYWDYIDIYGPKTISEIRKEIEGKYPMTVRSLWTENNQPSNKETMLYHFYSKNLSKKLENLDPVEAFDQANAKEGLQYPKKRSMMEIGVRGKTLEVNPMTKKPYEAKLPPIRYHI